MDVNLEQDMKNSAEVIALVADEEVANDFYRALCNMRWKKAPGIPDDELIIEKLKGSEVGVWSCSWRYAGGIIADIRNEHHGKSEDYMNFYCAGNESLITDTVRKCFGDMGWEPYPWEDEHY